MQCEASRLTRESTASALLSCVRVCVCVRRSIVGPAPVHFVTQLVAATAPSLPLRSLLQSAGGVAHVGARGGAKE